jgi:phosphatidylinositol alpha-1,6-mannosyltransferase
VCYLGLLPDEGRSSVAAPPPGCDPGRFAVAIGRMDCGERYKGFDELIRIWPRVERVHPEFKLVLIGDGSDRQRLQSLAGDVKASVVFTGGIDDELRDCFLRNCAALCLPSRGEGFGLVYLEAMRLSKPVLAGSTDAGREVVADGQTGRTVSGQDPEELLAGILDVLGERGKALGLAGRERFLEHFSYPRFYERFTGQLERTAGRTARTRATVNAAAIG